MDQKISRVLIGSCGGLTGIYLIKRLSSVDWIKLIGSDCSACNPAKLFLDEVWSVPPADDSGFVDELAALLNDREIDCYLPTHSSEIRRVSENELELRRRCPDTNFIVSPAQTFEALDGKEDMTRSLLDAHIPTPQLIAPGDEVPMLPLFAKRKRGSGGKDAHVVRDRFALAEAASNPDILLYEYVDGEELTIDCMFDANGVLLSYNQRRRVKTLGGAVVVTQNDYNIDCEPWLRAFEKNWVFKGCVNFQCIIDKGTPMFTDINLRYPSGGMPLSVESGVDIPIMTLKVVLGIPFDAQEYQSDRLNRTMYRTFEESFELA